MATPDSSSIFNEDKIRVFRIIHMTYFEVRDVLYQIYRWGTQDKDPTKTLTAFLLELGYPKATIKNSFSKPQKQLIEKDPLGEDFDLTLLVIATTLACKGLRRHPLIWVTEEKEDTLRTNINALKVFRNTCAHRQPLSISEFTFNEEINYLKLLLKSTLEIGADLYNIDKKECQKIVKATEEKLDRSKYDPIKDQETINNIIDKSIVEYQRNLLGEGKTQLIEKYKFFSSVNPASFFIGSNIHVNVDLVFTPMEIVEGDASKNFPDTSTVNYQDILEFTLNSTSIDESKTDILLIEGIAGSGKTTLTKLMMSEWQNNHGSIQHLLDYDLLIYFECRNSTIQSFTHLLETLMPNIVPRFKEGKLMKCVCTLKLLIIADGLDELNKTSTEVFKEILDIGSMTVMTIICTSRPEYVEKFYSLISSGQHVTHVKLNGIPKSNWEEFVIKYHKELKKTEISQHSAANLIHFLHSSSRYLEEALHLPLNLVWLTIMWSLNPDHMKKKIRNAAELHTEILLLKKKLLSNKLVKTDNECLRSDQLGASIDRFITHLSWEALVCLKDKALDSLPNESVCRLRNVCSSLDLPHDPTLSAFLVEKITCTTVRSQSTFSFDHKGEQDYLAANYLITALNGNDLRFDITSIVRVIQSHPSFQNELLRPGFIHRIMRFLDPSAPMRTSQTTVTDQQINNTSAEDDTDPMPKTVRGVLEGLYGTDQIPSDLSQYQNMLTYMAGLIQQVPEVIRPKIEEEIVVLFQDFGVKDKNQWIHLMREIKCDSGIAKNIATSVPNLVCGNTFISDAQVDQYSKLLPYGKPRKISMNMEKNVNNDKNFETLLNDLVDKENCPVHLFLHYHFKNPVDMNPALDEDLQRVFKCCKLQRFMGRLSGNNVSPLPTTIERLWLEIDHSNEEITANALKQLTETSTSLSTLSVHVTPNTDTSFLIPLSGKPELILFISGVNSHLVNWATEVAERLQPIDGSMEFTNIIFPRCQLNTEEFKELLERMRSREVKVSGVLIGGLIVSSTNIPPVNYQILQDKTRHTMNCYFTLQSEDKIWP